MSQQGSNRNVYIYLVCNSVFAIPILNQHLLYNLCAGSQVGMAHSEERYIASTVYGESGGGHWDDGLYHGVREITLRYGSCIDSFGVVYHRNGERIQSIGHGGKGGGSPKTVSFKLNQRFYFLFLCYFFLVKILGCFLFKP